MSSTSSNIDKFCIQYVLNTYIFLSIMFQAKKNEMKKNFDSKKYTHWQN